MLVHRIEARDPQGAARRLAASADPFDSWLRQEAAAVLGTDPWTHLAANAAPAGHTWMSVTSELTTTD